MLLNASLRNTLNYKVGIMDQVQQSREKSRALPNTLH